MNTFTDRLQQGAKLLWLDYSDYAGRLLSSGLIPWLQTDQLVNWQKRSAGLLPTDVISLPVGRVAAQWLETHADLVASMAAKRRSGAALRALLADRALRSHLVDLAKGLRACFPGKMLALVIPAPEMWVQQAHGQAFNGERIEVDSDLIDSAAMYIADFLREFAEAGIDVILLDDNRAGTEPQVIEAIEMYAPLMNLADHYRWALGVKTAGEPVKASLSPDFWITPKFTEGECRGLVPGSEFWEGVNDPCVTNARFLYLEIPADANPERVLERLSSVQ